MTDKTQFTEKFHSLLCFIVFLTPCLLFTPTFELLAAPITRDMALKVARQRIATDEIFLKAVQENPVPFRVLSIEPLSLDRNNDYAPAYKALLYPSGYMIISGDDTMPPVIAYSAKHNLDLSKDRANTFRALLEADLRHMAGIIKAVRSNKHFSDTQNQIQQKINAHRNAWKKLLENGNRPVPSNTIAADTYMDVSSNVTASNTEFLAGDPVIGPLLGELEWNQNNHYNELCPPDPDATAYYDGHMPTGCIATATGQVMKYFNWPPRGNGSHSYSWNGTDLSAIFSDPYSWVLMKDSYNPWEEEPYDSEMAVSELLFELGVSVEMDYSHDGSSASLEAANNAVENYFYYNSGTVHDDPDQFNVLVENSIDAGLPVLAGLDWHAVVIDGINRSVSPAVFHVNYGWGGHNNGWYNLDAFPAGGGIRKIITGIKPLFTAIMNDPPSSPDNDGNFPISWQFPAFNDAALAGFRVLEANYAESDFLDTADTFSSWHAASGWKSVDEGFDGAGFYFPPDKRVNPRLTLTDPFIPQAASMVFFKAKVVVIDAVLHLEVSTDNGTTWNSLLQLDKTASRNWANYSADLEAYAGTPLLLRFRIDTSANPFSYYPEPYGGVWLDNIEITSSALPQWQEIMDLSADARNMEITSRENGTYLYRVIPCSDEACGTPSPAISINVEIPELAGDLDRDGDVDGVDAALVAMNPDALPLQTFAENFGTAP